MSLNQILNPIKLLDIKCKSVSVETQSGQIDMTPTNGVGLSNQVLGSDGNGGVIWVNGTSGGGDNVIYSGSPTTIGTIPKLASTDGKSIEPSLYSETDITNLSNDVLNKVSYTGVNTTLGKIPKISNIDGKSIDASLYSESDITTLTNNTNTALNRTQNITANSSSTTLTGIIYATDIRNPSGSGFNLNFATDVNYNGYNITNVNNLKVVRVFNGVGGAGTTIIVNSDLDFQNQTSISNLQNFNGFRPIGSKCSSLNTLTNTGNITDLIIIPSSLVGNLTYNTAFLPNGAVYEYKFFGLISMLKDAIIAFTLQDTVQSISIATFNFQAQEAISAVNYEFTITFKNVNSFLSSFMKFTYTTAGGIYRQFTYQSPPLSGGINILTNPNIVVYNVFSAPTSLSNSISVYNFYASRVA